MLCYELADRSSRYEQEGQKVLIRSKDSQRGDLNDIVWSAEVICSRTMC